MLAETQLRYLGLKSWKSPRKFMVHKTMQYWLTLASPRCPLLHLLIRTLHIVISTVTELYALASSQPLCHTTLFCYFFLNVPPEIMWFNFIGRIIATYWPGGKTTETKLVVALLLIILLLIVLLFKVSAKAIFCICFYVRFFSSKFLEASCAHSPSLLVTNLYC